MFPPFEKITVPVLFLFLVVDDGWMMDIGFLKRHLQAYVPLGFSCPQKPETPTIGRTYPFNAA